MVSQLQKDPKLIDTTQTLALGTQYVLTGQTTALKMLLGISVQNSELLRQMSIFQKDLEETKKVHFLFTDLNSCTNVCRDLKLLRWLI
jgi:hypothetical protein